MNTSLISHINNFRNSLDKIKQGNFPLQPIYSTEHKTVYSEKNGYKIAIGFKYNKDICVDERMASFFVF